MAAGVVYYLPKFTRRWLNKINCPPKALSLKLMALLFILMVKQKHIAVVASL
jgi:hypothetical protein